MEKHEDSLERLLKSELEKEAGEIMKEVDLDDTLEDISFPEDLDEKMWKKIHDYEERQEAYEKLSDADKEAMRLGRELQALRGENEESEDLVSDKKIVPINRIEEDTDKTGEQNGKKKVRRKKRLKVYGIVAIVAILVMMFGMESIGGTPFLGKLWTQIIGKREMTQVDTEREGENENAVDDNDEFQVYDQIKEEMGCDVVRLEARPNSMEIIQSDIDKELKRVCLIYGNDDTIMEYQILFGYDNQSYGYDVEDEKISENNIYVENHKIKIIQYKLPDGSIENIAKFEYKDVYYSLNATMNEQDFENIVKNLYFY